MKKCFMILVLICLIAPLGLAKDKIDDNRYEIEMAEVGEPGTLVVKVWCYNKKPQISEDVAKRMECEMNYPTSVITHFTLVILS